MSSYSSYVPWRNTGKVSEDESTAIVNGLEAGDQESLDRTGRSGYGGLSSYRTGGSSGGSGGGLRGGRESRPTVAGPKYGAAAAAAPVKDEPGPRRSYAEPAYTPPETLTLRLGSSARFGGQIARSPLSEKSPTVFGVAPKEDASPPAAAPSPAPSFARKEIPRATAQAPTIRSPWIPAPTRPSDLPLFGQKKAVEEKTTPVGLVKSKTARALPPQAPIDLVNKDFRKSTLNMDPSKAPVKSKSKSGLPRPTKASTTTESDSSSSEEESEESSGSESSSAAEATSAKPPAGPRSVVVKALPPLASGPSRVKLAGSSSAEEQAKSKTSTSEASADEQPYRHYVLRKFDSTDKPWWAESTKDVPGIAKSGTSKGLNKSPSGVKAAEQPLAKSGSGGKGSEGSLGKSESSVKVSLDGQKLPSVKTLDSQGGLSKSGSSAKTNALSKSKSSVKSSESVPKTDSAKILSGLQSLVTDSQSGISKSGSSAKSLEAPGGLSKSGSSAKSLDGLSKTASSGGLSRSGSSAKGLSEPGGVQKSGSASKDLIAPLAETEHKVVEEDAKNYNEANHTPGFNRLHTKLYRIRKMDSGERAWWMESNTDIPGEAKQAALQKVASNKSISVPRDSRSGTTSGAEGEGSEASAATRDWGRPRLRKIESGERDWWLDDEEKEKKKKERRRRPPGKLYVGTFVNIDHLLGTVAPPPTAISSPSDDSDSCGEECQKIGSDQVVIHDSTPKSVVVEKNGMIKLDDTALQLYKDGIYGDYLDLEASIDEQQEEFDSFTTNRKNSIVLRTQLSVRVHTIIEKLHKSEGKELRRALFSLKQIFQEDKDLVPEFVQNDGLACLIKVGTDADQNHQNYILRALGQIMLYVDGMNGVIDHPATIQWLYKLVVSKFRLVVKTALKLLLVFVEYAESNCLLFVKSLRAVDYVHSNRPWSHLMRLMKEHESADTELLIYAMSLINKTLNGLPDQDSYYDQVDALEEQGLEDVIRRYMSKQGTDLDLLRQFQIYEAVLQHEDGEEKGAPLKQLDETMRKNIRNRKSVTSSLNPVERRKSRRNSTGNTPLTITLTPPRHAIPDPLSPTENIMNGLTNGTGPLTNGHSLHNGIDNHIELNGQVCREGSVKDLTQKLATTLHSPTDPDSKLPNGPFGDMKGIISKAKEGLAKSGGVRVGADGSVLSPPDGRPPPPLPLEIKKSESDLHWEALVAGCAGRDLALSDLDFRDLGSEDETDPLAPSAAPPCPPLLLPPPPPTIGGFPSVPAAPPTPRPPPPSPATPKMAKATSPSSNANNSKKTKKTVKLFWKEVREDPIVINKMNASTLLWDELSPVAIDTQKLEHLFESRAKDLITKKQQEMNKSKEIIVLDPKRSNAINIGMTKLPPPRSIKTAILKMDATVMNREGIEKLLTMLPSEEERSKIQEAQAGNPDLPLGSAEQFLLTLASISELDARLKLWAFKLDYENSEKEIAEPLMDLKQGMETLRGNKTFRAILGTLLSIGIFLNGTEVKGFQIEYLSKVPEVKDTVQKHSLLHHLCHMVMEKFPDSTDLYSEIGAVTRASKVDFEELTGNIQKMEQECKASFNHLKLISKHDGTTNMKLKMSDFLADCAERIIVLGKVHKRVFNRFRKFCLWLGTPLHRVGSVKPNELCRIVSEFALEYRTTRERVIQQLEKKASHRERNKTRGKMITEVGKFRSQEDRADAELKQLLGNEKIDKSPNNILHGSLPWRRTRKSGESVLSPVDGVANGTLADADDEILESLVKTATKSPVSRTAPRERKRTRNADRKSLIKRSRTRENIPRSGNISESAS